MFSGANSGTELYWANALAQSQSQNNSLDWALLAQQWISQQQNLNNDSNTLTNFVTPNQAPPPPRISLNHEEQGEADMDVEDEHNEPNQIENPNQNQEFVPPPPQIWSLSSPTPIPLQVVQQQFTQPVINSNPWHTWCTPTMLNTNLPPPTLHIPDLNSPSDNADKMNKPIIPSLMDTPISAPVDNQFPTLDAAKRKTLPAWIREGLEKMEREKQKQQEKEKAATVSSGSDKYDNQIGLEKFNDLGDKNDKTLVSSTKSNYTGYLKQNESSSDESEVSDNESGLKKQSNKSESSINAKPHHWHGKSRDEIEEEMMRVVKKTLTEILLEITNAEIRSIAQETLKKQKLKASSAQVIRKSALTSISGNLGLGAYDSDSNNDSDDEASSKNAEKDYDKDSEDELRDIMQSKQRTFKTVAREIELLMEKETERQEEIRQERLRREQLERSSERLLSHGGDDYKNEYSRRRDVNFDNGKSNYCRDFGETHHDKKSYSSNGKKRFKERTSRFSDNKESKQKSSSSIPSTSSTYLIPAASNNTLHTGNTPYSSATIVSNNLLHHQTTTTIAPSAQILSNSAAAQNFLMANAVISQAFKNDERKYKRSKHSRRSRSHSSDSSSNSSYANNFKNTYTSRKRSSSTSSSGSGDSRNIKKSNKRAKRSKSRERSHDHNDYKSEHYHSRNYKNSRNVDDRLDSVEYNQDRTTDRYHKSTHRQSSSSDDERSSTRVHKNDEHSSSHYFDTYNKSSKQSANNDSKKNKKNDNLEEYDDEHRKYDRHYSDNSAESDDYQHTRRNYSRYARSSRSDKRGRSPSSINSRHFKTSHSRRHESRSRSRSRSKSNSSKNKYYDKY